MTGTVRTRVDGVMGRLGGVRAVSILAGVVALATALRVWAYNWALPNVYHPDEWTVVDGAVDMARRNSFEPTMYYRPDHLEIKINYLLYVAYGRLQGTPVEVLFDQDHSPFYAMARLTTAAFGVGCVVVTYLVAKRVSVRAGLLASAAIAVFPIGVLHAHYATPDVPLTFLFLVITYLCVKYLENPSTRTAAWAGVTVGAAVTVKYPGVVAASVIALVVTVVAARERSVWRWLRDGAAALVALVAAVFVISPVLFTNVTGVRESIRRESRDQHFGADGLGFFGNVSFYSETFVVAAGALVAAAAVWGLVVLVRRRQWVMLPLVLGLVMGLAISVLSLHWIRWGIPVFTTPLVLAAVGIDDLLSRAWAMSRDGWVRRASVGGIGAAAGLAGLSMTASGFAQTVELDATDTRTIAAEWLDENGVTPENAYSEGYTPFLPNSGGQIIDELTFVGDRLEPVQVGAKEYVVVNAGYLVQAQRQPERLAEHIRIYEALDEQYEKVAEFLPAELPQRDTDRRLLVPVVGETLTLTTSLRSAIGQLRGDWTGSMIVVYRIPSTLTN